MNEPRPRGVFAGLATLDVVHRVTAPPAVNEKITATAQFVASGGPAANAAVTFAALGGDATLVTALGRSPVAQTIIDELRGVGVAVIDVHPGFDGGAPVSSVIVTESSGDRAVVGGDAVGMRTPAPDAEVVRTVIDGADAVLVDGHHPDVSVSVARAARQAGIRVIVDAGRWKPAMAEVIPVASDVVASADFRVPDSPSSADTASRLIGEGAPVVVVTDGPNPIRWWRGGRSGVIETEPVAAVDTLAAGDVFHGAYAFAAARGLPLEAGIAFAAEVAAVRCTMVGPRSWLSAIAEVPLVRGVE
ncbi:PfkB family carbohydrate kinase [Microbacterium soli]|uniref:PfkB family carbohydrate kinase n=1 Tax=Microbacterium soli TaxID=446075 RepID=A0ABP7N4W2_9MICO